MNCSSSLGETVLSKVRRSSLLHFCGVPLPPPAFLEPHSPAPVLAALYPTSQVSSSVRLTVGDARGLPNAGSAEASSTTGRVLS